MFALILWYRSPVAAYCSKIYKMPSDDPDKAKTFKEAPIIDNEKILTDKKILKEKENQSSLISIPVEVSADSIVSAE